MKKILVTCALPYSNGSIHLGHIMEHIQADVWVRYNRLLGNDVYFICADDSHGTAIILKSKQLNINPEVMINNFFNDHKNQFKKFNIFHDFYYTTHNKSNYLLSLYVLDSFKKKGFLKEKNINQYYDVKRKIFLPDRFIKGKCPKCYSKNQYGDICECCGNIYNSIDLINPISCISGSVPELRSSNHLFLELSKFKKILIDWICKSYFQKEVSVQLLSWLDKGNLNDWCISRDSPYFGFKIPNKYIINKYFYVWLDALLSYISTFHVFCKKKNLCIFDDYWLNSSSCELYQFIGKDILYFHGLLWPIILHISNFRKPTQLIVHGHLVINNYKMSKSRLNFITVNKWLRYFDSDSLRYYFCTKLSNDIKDINLCLFDFVNKFNSDFVNKFVNLISRVSKFIECNFHGFLANQLLDSDFYFYFVNKSNLISNYFLNFHYSKALSTINCFLDLTNKYVNDKKPWLMLKNKNMIKLHEFCTTVINIFKVISIYISPIMPELSYKIEKLLNLKLIWSDLNKPILNHKISKYKKLYVKIDNSVVNDFINNK